MTLEPKPSVQNPLLGWDVLNNHLQMMFRTNNKSKKPIAEVNPQIFEMSEEDIITEATNKGYKTTKISDTCLRFE